MPTLCYNKLIMSEAISSSLEFEQELSELAKKVETVRAERESEAGMESEAPLETVHKALGELVADEFKTVKPEGAPISSSTSYLNSIGSDQAQLVNDLIAEVPTKGLKKTINRVADNPALLDMFHDALTDFLYEELKQRNLV